MVKFISNQEYSPEALDRVFTVPNVISFLRICSIPYLAILIAQNKMGVALYLLFQIVLMVILLELLIRLAN